MSDGIEPHRAKTKEDLAAAQLNLMRQIKEKQDAEDEPELAQAAEAEQAQSLEDEEDAVAALQSGARPGEVGRTQVASTSNRIEATRRRRPASARGSCACARAEVER